MGRMIFVNLPVEDLPRSKAFYEALGFANNPKFSDDTAACMVWSDAIYVMILSHAKWATFTDRPIPDKGSSEVALCLACESREEVEALTSAAGSAGGIVDVNPPQDHGFMMSRSFTDLDGHVWEPMWMDPAVASDEAPLPA
jgi:predicted lactoylglutathione lyase